MPRVQHRPLGGLASNTRDHEQRVRRLEAKRLGAGNGSSGVSFGSAFTTTSSSWQYPTGWPRIVVSVGTARKFLLWITCTIATGAAGQDAPIGAALDGGAPAELAYTSSSGSSGMSATVCAAYPSDAIWGLLTPGQHTLAMACYTYPAGGASASFYSPALVAMPM